MRSFVTYTLLASTSVVAAISPRFEFPDTVPALEKRQEPGTPRYQCHEDCGLLITLGREEGYCDNSEWNERYGRCMNCANTFEIWQYYRNGVTSAAEECGLSPTPSPSGFTASSTAAEEPATTAQEPATTEAEDPATTAADDDEASTDAAEEPATTAAEETTADDSTPGATTTADGSAPEETETDAEETDAEETDGSAEETTDASTTADPTTFSTTQSAAVTGTPNPTETEAGSAGTRTSAGEIGTIGVTTTGTPSPSTVVVNGAAKQFGFSTAIAVAALAMLGLY